MTMDNSKKFNPPNGLNFRSEPELTDKVMVPALQKIVSWLQQKSPYETLRLYHDWWEHDGLHFSKGETDFPKLFEMIASSKSLVEAMPRDEDVFIGIAPEDTMWYLRFYFTWNDEGTELQGRFDVTLPESWVENFNKDVVEKIGTKLVKEGSQKYYASILPGG